MRLPDSIRYSLAALAAGVIAWVAMAQQPARPVVDAKALVSAASNEAEWLTYGRDYAETHYSPLTQINDKNIGRLKLAWSWPTEAPQGQTGVEATPLMHNGVLYGSLTWGVLWAADARTGKMKWRWDPEIPRERISRAFRTRAAPSGASRRAPRSRSAAGRRRRADSPAAARTGAGRAAPSSRS